MMFLEKLAQIILQNPSFWLPYWGMSQCMDSESLLITF